MRRALALLAILLALAPAARAEDVTLKLHHLRNEGPLCKKGRWTWIAAELENKGAAPVEGALRASRVVGSSDRSPIAYERRLTIAPHSRRIERLLYFCREAQGRVEVGFFRGAGADPIASAFSEVTTSDDFLAVVLSRGDAAFPMVRDALVGGMRRRDVFAAPLSLDELPDRAEALQAVDGILVADVDLRSLAPAQAEALEGFVLSGGQLILCFGGNRLEYKDGPLEPLLPVAAPDDVRPMPTPALAAFGGSPPGAIAGDLLVAVARPLAGSTVLVREGDVPLAVRRRYGKGLVTYLAVDPTHRPFHGSTAAPGVIGRLFGSSDPPDQNVIGGDRPDDAFDQKLHALASAGKEITPPPFLVIGALLAAYIVLVVPLNYGFWRRRGRAERTAPTAALLGVLAGGVVYEVGIAYKGTVGFTTEVLLLEGAEGEARGRATAWAGVVSPDRHLGRIEARLAAADEPPSGDAMGRPGAEDHAATVRVDATAERGRRFALEQVELNQWMPRQLLASGPADTPVVETELVLMPGRIRGLVKAPQDAALRRAFLIVGRRMAFVGNVPAGTASPIATPLRAFEDGLAEVAGASLSTHELEALLARRPILPCGEDEVEGLLVATTDPEPEAIVATDFSNRRESASRLLVAAVPIRLESGRIELSRGVVRPRVTAEVDGRVTAEGPAGQIMGVVQEWRGERAYRFERGRLDLEFTLPGRARLKPERAQIFLRFTADNPQARIFLRGPGGDRQVKKDELNGSTIEVKDPAPFYDPRTGTFRVTLDTGDGGPLVFVEPEIGVIGRLEGP
jgi:hypothetical protein